MIHADCRSRRALGQAAEVRAAGAALSAGHRRGAWDHDQAHVPAEGDAAVSRAAARPAGRTIAACIGSTATSRAASSASPATCARRRARPTASTSSPPRRPGPTARNIPEMFVIDELRCIYCGMCEQACPCDAIELTSLFDLTGLEPRGDDVRQGEAAERVRPDGGHGARTRSAPRAGR